MEYQKVLPTKTRTLVLACLLACGFPAGGPAAEPPATEAVQERLDRLEDRLKALEGSPGASTPEVKELADELADVGQRLDRAERKTLKDKLDFGLSFRTRWDNFEFTDTTGQKNEHERNYNVWSERFRLRMVADGSENLKFHGRMTVYKNWADVDYSTDRFWDANASEIPSDNTVRLDRAYADLLFRDLWVPLAVTVGRQPTVGGPPDHIKDDTEARSTFPSIAFEREVEGITLTAGLERFTGLGESALRVMYGKFLQPDNDKSPWLSDRGEDTHLFWAQAESNLPGAWSETKAMLTYVRSWDYAGAPYESVTAQPGSLGYAETSSATIVSDDLYGLGIAWFTSAAYSKTHGSGSTIWIDKNGNGTQDLGPTVPPDKREPNVGLLSSDGRADRDGYAVYLGARCELPIDLLRQPKIGVEYNHGSRYWWTIHAGTEDPLDKLATRGNAWEVYYIQPLMPGAMLRFGVMDINYNYSSAKAPLGKPSPVDQHLRNTYILLDVNF